MTIRSKDYNMLVNLRDNLISLPELRKIQSSADYQLSDLKTYASGINKSACGVPTPDYHEMAHKVEEAYRAKTIASREPYIQRLKAKHRTALKAAGACSVILKFISWALVLLLIFIVEKFMLQMDFFSKFGFSHFLGHQWSGWFIKDINQLSTGEWISLYIIGASLGCALSFGLLYLIASFFDIDFLCGATKFISIATACIALLAWFIVGCIEVSDWGISGLWWIVAWPLVFIAMAFCFIYIARILFAALIGFGIPLLIIIPLVLLVVCFIISKQFEPFLSNLFSKEKQISKCYEVSFAQLHETDEYKHAVEQDTEAYATKHAKYEQAVTMARKQAEKTYAELIVRQTSAVENIQYRLTRCENEISSCSIHQSYKNVRTLNELLYYFEYDMASTLQEAVNCRNRDIQARKMESQIQAYNKRLDAMKAESERMHREKIEEIKRLQEIQQAIQSDINKNHEQMARAAEKISDKASDISSELGRINASINSIW